MELLELYHKFVVDPGRFRIPGYYISPFLTNSISENYQILQSGHVDQELLQQYFGFYHCFINGKAALHHALMQYGLSEDDEVYIITTSGNRYISGCVTGVIDKICKWNRQLSSKTKIILVVHEFGVVYRQMDEVLKLGLPVIEDKAMSLFSTDAKRKTGHYGDYTIYSLPKFFPVQYGGILQINTPEYDKNSFEPDPNIFSELEKYLSFYLKDTGTIIRKRKHNHALFQSHLTELGFQSRFEYSADETPSAYMCSTPPSVHLDGLKIFLQQNGVECSVFYGESAFFIPVQQNLNEVDILCIVSLIKYFVSER